MLNLPVLNIGSSIFSGVGVGNDSTPAPYGYSSQTNYNQYRAFFQDTWKIKPNFTLNYGLAWDAQTGFYNSNLPKPAYLAPILGAGNLGPTASNIREFQPAFGFTWSPFANNRTVIRGGGGIYWDSTPGYYKLREAAAIGPPGNGRSTLAASAFTNIYPGILNLNLGGVPDSRWARPPLPLNALTTMTIGQFVNLVQTELPSITAGARTGQSAYQRCISVQRNRLRQAGRRNLSAKLPAGAKLSDEPRHPAGTTRAIPRDGRLGPQTREKTSALAKSTRICSTVISERRIPHP